jgi:hypothetical protein
MRDRKLTERRFLSEGKSIIMEEATMKHAATLAVIAIALGSMSPLSVLAPSREVVAGPNFPSRDYDIPVGVSL